MMKKLPRRGVGCALRRAAVLPDFADEHCGPSSRCPSIELVTSSSMFTFNVFASGRRANEEAQALIQLLYVHY